MITACRDLETRKYQITISALLSSNPALSLQLEVGHLWLSSILKRTGNAVGPDFGEGVLCILQRSCEHALPSGCVFGHFGGPLAKSHTRHSFWILESCQR